MSTVFQAGARWVSMAPCTCCDLLQEDFGARRTSSLVTGPSADYEEELWSRRRGGRGRCGPAAWCCLPREPFCWFRGFRSCSERPPRGLIREHSSDCWVPRFASGLPLASSWTAAWPVRSPLQPLCLFARPPLPVPCRTKRPPCMPRPMPGAGAVVGGRSVPSVGVPRRLSRRRQTWMRSRRASGGAHVSAGPACGYLPRGRGLWAGVAMSQPAQLCPLLHSHHLIRGPPPTHFQPQTPNSRPGCRRRPAQAPVGRGRGAQAGVGAARGHHARHRRPLYAG